jgi:PAS domain S-box-containing protein
MKRLSGMLAVSGKSFGIFENPQRRALLTSAIIFVFLLMPLLWYSSLWYEDVLIKDRKAQDTIHLTTHGNALTTAVNERFALLDGLFAFTAVNPSDEVLKTDFDVFASGLYSGATGIRNFALAPDGVQRYVNPLKDNENVIGHDLINDPRPEVRADVQRAMNTQKTAISGPYELRQDGLGLVARKALYVNDTFWGIVTMVIDMPPIFEEAGFYSQQADIEFAVKSSSGNIIFGNESVFGNEPVNLRIELPEGYWELGGIPKEGWRGAVAKELFVFQASGLIISILIGIMIYLFISRFSLLEMKVQERTQELQEEINGRKRTQEALMETEERYKASFEKARDGIIIFSKDRRFLSVNEEIAKLCGYSKEELLSMKLPDIFKDASLPESSERIARMLKGERISPFEAQLSTKSGNSIPAEISVTFLKNVYGFDIVFQGIIRDITERKQAEAAMNKERDKVQQFLDIAGVMITVLDASGDIVLINKKGCNILEYTDAVELLGCNWFEMCLPERIRDEVLTVFKKLIAGDVEPVEYFENPVVTRTGVERIIAFHNTVLRDSASQIIGILFSGEDITERKQTEKALQESEERLRLATELANVAVWEYSFITNSMSRSKNHDKLYGLEWQTKWDLTTFTNATHPDDREYSNGIIQKSVAKGGPDQYEFDFRVVYPDKSIHWLMVVGQVIERNSDGQGIIVRGSLIDITERKHAEEKLIHAHDLMQYVISHAQGAIAVHDRDLKYLYVSEQYLKQYNVKEKDVIEKHYYEVFPDLPQKWRDVHQKALAGEVSGKDEDSYEREDGTVDWTRWECRPWYESDGSIGGIIVYTEVITRRVLEKEELKKHRDRLEELVEERTASLTTKSEQLHENQIALTGLVEELERSSKDLNSANIRLKELDCLKSMFIASTSHELRTPLNSIIGFSSILLEGYSGELNPEQKEQLGIIHSSGEHLLSLITDVIDLSKIEAGRIDIHISEFKLRDVVDEAVSMLDANIKGKGLDLSVEVEDIPMKTERRRLLQCITNLLGNAVKFTEKGSIKITARIIKKNVDISVTDTGIGIKTGDIPKLFAPFVRLESPLTAKTSGTGLGLYLSKKLARDILGGDVDVESEHGKGSTFTLRVPAEL